MSAYGTSAVKRQRRTRAELDELHAAIMSALADEGDRPATVRGVFYRVMSAGAVPKSEHGYAAVQREVLKLRRAGVLPYEWITDGTRWRVHPASWVRLEEMLADAAASYRRAMWHDQPVYVEVWSEKDAIKGVVSSVTAGWDVPLMVARGFPGESFLWAAGQEITRIGKPTVIYQLGDHDPSGVAAWEQTQAALRRFAPGIDVRFERLAVTPEQVDRWGLPTRPTKQTDSRARRFTGESVEVDAIPSGRLRTLVRDAIVQHVEPEAWRLARAAEDSERAVLQQLAGVVGEFVPPVAP